LDYEKQYPPASAKLGTSLKGEIFELKAQKYAPTRSRVGATKVSSCGEFAATLPPTSKQVAGNFNVFNSGALFKLLVFNFII